MDPNDPRGRVVRAQDWLPPEFVENHPLGSFAVGFGTEVGIALYLLFSTGPRN